MIDKGWKAIQDAPTEPVVGCRSEIILGIDAHGDVHKTFYVGSESNGGPAWVITGHFGVQTWNPILWIELPDMELLLM